MARDWNSKEDEEAWKGKRKLKKLKRPLLRYSEICELRQFTVRSYATLLTLTNSWRALEKTEESEDGQKIITPEHSALIATEVEDLDKAYKELKSKSVNFIKEPKMQSWGQYAAYFTDPDGHIWEIFTWKK